MSKRRTALEGPAPHYAPAAWWWRVCVVSCVIGSMASSARAETGPPVRSVAGPSVPQKRSQVPAWLPWTFVGLGAATALTSILAWRAREGHVDRWNSAACLEAGRTRVQTCSDEYYAGRDAEVVAWVSGVSSVAFVGSALFLGHTRATVSASAVTIAYSGTF